MKLFKVDEELDKKLQQVYNNLPYINTKGPYYDTFTDVNKFQHTKIFLGGVDSKNIVKQAFPIKIVTSRNARQGIERNINSCTWAPGFNPESLQVAIFETYKKKLIPGAIIRISNAICGYHINYFGNWWSTLPPDTQIITYSTVGKTINTRSGNQGTVKIHKIKELKIATNKKQGELYVRSKNN